MRQQVANTFVASFALAGCSLIYNPSNLPDKKDAGNGPVDAEIPVDADPNLLALERVFPTTIFEGAGTGGSRRIVVTIHGVNLIPEATVAITAHGAGAPKLTVDNSLPDRVAENGHMIAVPVTLMVDNMLAGDQEIRLDVTVTQPTSMGDKVVELTELDGGAPVLVLKGLPELTSAATVQLPGGDYTYSQVSVTGDLEGTGETPLRVTSTSSINISGAVKVISTNRNGVAGGGDGGDSAGNLVASKPGAGAGPNGVGGGTDAGGGGYGAKGGGAGGGPEYGSESLHTLFGGSGGAGGNGSAIGTGGAGGGGGGIIELTAHGNLTVAAAEAKGAAGSGGGSQDGAGGAGGSILLRSFATLAATALAVDGGAGSNTGAVGRARFDAAMGPMAIGTAYRGPMFHPMTPLITRNEKPSLTITGKPLEQFSYFWESEDGQGIKGPFSSSIATNGTNMITLPDSLYRGSNTLCLLVKGAELANTNREARNCIQLVYLHRYM